MTKDTNISADLAIVGRTSRERPLALEATLRAVGGGGVARSSPTAIDAALVAMSRVYSLRVARIAAGVAAMAFVLARLVFSLIPETPNEGLVFDLLWVYPESLPRFLAGVAIVYLFAANVGAVTFRRAVGTATDPHVRARTLVDSVDGWSVAMAIASTSTIVIADMAGRIMFHGPLLWLQSMGAPDWTEGQALLYAIPLVAPILASWICAFVVARRRGLRIRPWLVAIAFPLIVTGIVVVDQAVFAEVVNMIAFATVMTLVVCVVVALVLHRQDRERDAIEGKEAS